MDEQVTTTKVPHTLRVKEKSFIVFRIVLLQELAKGSSSAPTPSYVHPDF